MYVVLLHGASGWCTWVHAYARVRECARVHGMCGGICVWMCMWMDVQNDGINDPHSGGPHQPQIHCNVPKQILVPTWGLRKWCSIAVVLRFSTTHWHGQDAMQHGAELHSVHWYLPFQLHVYVCRACAGVCIGMYMCMCICACVCLCLCTCMCMCTYAYAYALP